MNLLPISDTDLHAYVDGQLAVSRRPDVEAAMSRDPALAGRVAEMRRQNDALREAFDLWIGDPLPERLLIAAEGPAYRRRGLPRWALPLLSVAAALLVGVVVGWFGRDLTLEREGTPTTYTRSVALTHALYAGDVNRPVEIWAAEEKRLVSWLSKRLGFPVRAPDLNSVGFALVGGRLVAGNEMPTALFMYENADKQRLSLQVRRQPAGSGEAAFRYAVEGGVGVYYWIDEHSAYALSGNLDRAQLLSVGHVVYGQLAALEATLK